MTTLLRVSTAGNVDDGKSTLIGRLLVETNSVPLDTLEAIRKASKDFEGGFDYSLITDGLSSEQEQKITIDVAYRYFRSDKRQFILADTPGHAQYTRNMVTGASTSDVAIVLVDVSKGVTTQSRRHAIISSLLGVSHLIVAVNKMDLAEFAEDKFLAVKEQFSDFSANLNIKDIRFVPVCALHGDNVVARSAKMPWYEGDTLSQLLDGLYTKSDQNLTEFRFAVQRVVPTPNGRLYMGRIASGEIKVGDPVVVLPAGHEAKVSEVTTPTGTGSGSSGQSISLKLDREIDVSRGDMLAAPDNMPIVDTTFDSHLIWLDEAAFIPSQIYWMKHGTAWTRARVEEIDHKIDVDTLDRVPAQGISLNEIAKVSVSALRPLAFDPYAQNRETGSFILVDPATERTVAGGLIIDRVSMARRTVDPGQRKTILFTGLSGAGKSSIAERVYKSLKLAGIPATWLDGDSLRKGLSKDLKFTKEARQENLRRMAEVAKLFNNEGLHVVASFIAPLEEHRDLVREIVGEDAFVEVFVDASLEVCAKRDPKGWYKLNKAGQIKEFTGINAPYERPGEPNLHLTTETLSIDESVDKVLNLLLRN